MIQRNRIASTGPTGQRSGRAAGSTSQHGPLGTHLQGDQISRMESALAYLKTQGIDPGEVIAISPFRAVTQKLEELSKRPEYRGLLPARSMPPRGGKQPLYSWSLAATRHRCESVGGVDRQPRQRGR
jgi:hypothetical protein